MRARMSWNVAGLALAGLATLSGCCLTQTKAPPTTFQPGGVATATVGSRVSIVPAGFVPRTITIKVGDRVTWVNQDSVRHNVGGTGLVSGLIAPGGSYTRLFETAGTYQYLCTFHPDTEGLVVVVPR